jgi:hypothetical protein
VYALNALIQVQSNSVRTSKKIEKKYVLLSLITFNAHQVSVSAFFLHDVLLHWGILHHTQ